MIGSRVCGKFCVFFFFLRGFISVEYEHSLRKMLVFAAPMSTSVPSVVGSPRKRNGDVVPTKVLHFIVLATKEYSTASVATRRELEIWF